jgi:hypothetical protein
MLIFVISFIYGCIINNHNLYNKSVKTPLYFKNDKVLNKYTNKYTNNNSGIDERYTNFSKEEDCSLEKIKELFDKKKILDILKNDDVSILTKLSLLEIFEQGIKPVNLFAGGLLNDFEFDI